MSILLRCVFAVYVFGAYGGQWKVSILLDLELQTFAGCHERAGPESGSSPKSIMGF